MVQEHPLRSPDAIVGHLLEHQAGDLFGFATEVLARYLTAAQAKPLCKPEADLSDWQAVPLTRDGVLEEMRAYMAFAWGKVLDHRGLSAGRNIDKMKAWLWLLGDDEAVAFAENSSNYPQYGAPVLLYICERYGFQVPGGDEARNMAAGEPCEPGCQNGCGR